MNRLEVVKKKDFCYFNKRWGTLDALSKFGSTIVSHQIKNELNYSYLEALFLKPALDTQLFNLRRRRLLLSGLRCGLSGRTN